MREPIIKVASSFANLKVAEVAVSKVLRTNASRIHAWAQAAGVRKVTLEQEIGSVIGYGVVRASGQLVHMTKVIVTLKLETYRGMPYYVLTAFVSK